jgi:peptide/nickel transport system ATP-binding protein
MAMLLITHDMGVVAEVADEVAVMRFGRIVERGPVDAIYHAAKHPYTKQLLASTLKLTHHQEGKVPAIAKAAENPQPILSVHKLSKVYGWAGRNSKPLRAVDDASFDLYPGENLGIVGESGSGKTTLGRLILRTVEPTSGSVTFRGNEGREIDVTKLGKRDLRHFHREVRLVFQDPFASLNPRLTVKEVIGDPLVVNGLAKGKALEARVAELMKLVGLDPMMMERYPHAFSGGQRQRIGIARALALDPKIIIADEATSALDVSIRSQILDLLLDIRQRLNLSFLFISHDISVIRYFCDRVAVMHRGKIVEIGEAEQICTAPNEAYTKSLISAVPNPDPRDKRMLHRQRFNAPAL